MLAELVQSKTTNAQALADARDMAFSAWRLEATREMADITGSAASEQAKELVGAMPRLVQVPVLSALRLAKGTPPADVMLVEWAW